jgi:large subunit ribosomal protein L30
MALLITQIKSQIGSSAKHRGTLRALGLGRIGKTTVRNDSPELQGMLRKVNNLIRIEEAPNE